MADLSQEKVATLTLNLETIRTMGSNSLQGMLWEKYGVIPQKVELVFPVTYRHSWVEVNNYTVAVIATSIVDLMKSGVEVEIITKTI